MHLPEDNSKALIIKYATQKEFDQIHSLNHEIFAEEIPQHSKRSDQKLVDSFHEVNTYILAMQEDELLGMVCYNSQRPFSLEKKMERMDDYLPEHRKVMEVRLLAVKKHKRKLRVTYLILKKLSESIISEGCDLIVFSATTRELKLYGTLGAKPFGELVGTKEVPYQPMYLHLNHLKDDFRI